MAQNKDGTKKRKVLLMDDDEIILSAINGLLVNLGYNIETCRDGWQAISLYEKALKDNNPFDAVVMDLNIPDSMGGKKAMEELLHIDPHAKGIVSSGFPNDSVMSDYRKHGFSGAVEKPYKIEELDKVLTQVISEKSQ